TCSHEGGSPICTATNRPSGETTGNVVPSNGTVPKGTTATRTCALDVSAESGASVIGPSGNSTGFAAAAFPGEVGDCGVRFAFAADAPGAGFTGTPRYDNRLDDRSSMQPPSASDPAIAAPTATT